MENHNLLWEILPYCPWILFSIEPTRKRVQKLLGKKKLHLSHFYYFLESEFGYTNIRDSDFT